MFREWAGEEGVSCSGPTIVKKCLQNLSSPKAEKNSIDNDLSKLPESIIAMALSESAVYIQNLSLGICTDPQKFTNFYW